MYHSQPNTGAYGGLDPAILSPKAAEARVVSQVTRRLIAYFSDDATPFAKKAEALHDNRRLWTAIAAAVASDANALPEALRAGLIGLAAFVDRQTTEILAGTGDVRLLIDVNRRVIAGLSEDG